MTDRTHPPAQAQEGAVTRKLRSWMDTTQTGIISVALLREAIDHIAALTARNAELEEEWQALRLRIERLLVECGFSTPAILRILDPLFGEGPADYGLDDAPKKHPDCVAVMCGKVDCRYPGPCYVAALAPARTQGEETRDG